MKFYQRILLCGTILIVNAVLSWSALCQTPVPREDVNWTRINRVWHDAMDMPTRAMPVDCWDWSNFTAVADGFTTTINQWDAGNSENTHSNTLHFIRKRKGIYSLEMTHREEFRITTKNAVEHKKTPAMFENIDAVTDIFFDMELFFFTDYETYFIPGGCVPELGLLSWIKTSKIKPTTDDLLDIWNVLVEYQITGPLFWKETCVNRIDK